MSKRWLKDFLRYINKVFLPEGCTKWAKDERKDPEDRTGYYLGNTSDRLCFAGAKFGRT
ncbi:hypothetical protein [Syntrophaceticus schinkii]|uniref:hypothetical protein n=1 Tax=Syntrophaceticus schinkii TaxID=499207 RepID=UPI0012EC6B8C|nr:hypothetical protein [Syntrophaceticus schinkii]